MPLSPWVTRALAGELPGASYDAFAPVTKHDAVVPTDVTTREEWDDEVTLFANRTSREREDLIEQLLVTRDPDEADAIRQRIITLSHLPA